MAASSRKSKRLPVNFGHPGDPLPPQADEIARRLWALVDRSQGPDACWMWQGSLAGKPKYRRGWLQVEGAMDTAHYWAWRLTHPREPRPRYLGSTCATEGCCNPKHYLLNRGRGNKLSDAQVTALRALLDGGMSQSQAARLFGVTQQMASLVAHGYRDPTSPMSRAPGARPLGARPTHLQP